MSDTIKGFRGKDGPILLDYSGVANVPGAIQSIGELTARPGDHFEVETVDSTGRVVTVKAVEKPSGGSGQNLNLTSPNGTVYMVAVKDDGTLYTVKQGEEPGEPEEPVLPDEPVAPDIPDIEWHTITADEITGINADRRLIATYTGTAENILIPATLDGKPVVMNTAANAPFDTNGVIKNIRIENAVGGTFQANPSEAVYGLGNIQTFRAGAAVKRIVIDSDNPDCTEFNCSGATALKEVHGLHHLTALTNGSMMFKGTAIQKLDVYPPKLSNAKLMFWQCSNLETVPDISMELSDCNNMFLQCTKLSEVTVSAMKGCDITMIGGSSPNGGNFTFRCNYGSSLYESFRGMICHSMNSKENLFIELLDNYPVEDIVMWGDSMTKAGNTTMGNMPDQLAEMVTDDVMVWNYGYSGNTIQACAARFNNHPEKWGDTTVIWLGTNNTAMSGGDMTALIQSEFINKLTTDNYVVVGLLTTNYSDEKNAAFASAFGDHFLDIRGYFLEHMWEISGLTATEQDESDIANGLIPSSFRVDVTHLNPAGGRIVATAIREKLLDMGIITDAQTVAE